MSPLSAAVPLDFSKLITIGQSGQAVIPVAVQDADSGQVLVVAYTNDEAFQYTLTHGIVAFWSTSRNELWIKGAHSGDQLELVEAFVNCEENSLLYTVRMKGQGVCHTRNQAGLPRKTCYFRRITPEGLENCDP